MERADLQRQMDKMRGQLEEMRGRMEQMYGREAAGLTREMTRRGRETMTEMRGRAEGLTERAAEQPGMTFGLGALALLGMSVLALAVFAPRTFRRYIDRLFEMLGF